MSQRARSPILGYNHNVRHGDRLWHVQTEDSGVHNPHIFTHLFYNGTILATRKTTYDPGADVDTVQKLMQAQHKTVMRELREGLFDSEIRRFFPDALPANSVMVAEIQSAPPGTATPPPAQPKPAAPAHVPPPVAAPPRAAPPQAAPPAARAAAPPSGARAPIKPTAPVVVARPAFIVGTRGVPAPANVRPPAPRPQNKPAVKAVTETSLDDAILAYLSDDEPKKK